MARARNSSNLGADIRGDTSAPAMSTRNEVSLTDPEVVEMGQFKDATGHYYAIPLLSEAHLCLRPFSPQKSPRSRIRSVAGADHSSAALKAHV